MHYVKNNHGKWTKDINPIAVLAEKIAPVADTLIPFEVSLSLSSNALRIAGPLRVEEPGHEFTAEFGPYFLRCKLKKFEGNELSFEAIAFIKE